MLDAAYMRNTCLSPPAQLQCLHSRAGEPTTAAEDIVDWGRGGGVNNLCAHMLEGSGAMLPQENFAN